MKPLLLAIIAMALALPAPAIAGKADVTGAKAVYEGKDLFSFEVTVFHGDEGWKHYADRWVVVTPDGKVIATRVLMHPHVDEQPFTRGLSSVKIPPSITHVTIRAHDSVHGYGGRDAVVALRR